MDIAEMLGRSLIRLEGLVEVVGDVSVRHQMESELSDITAHLAGLLTAHRVLEERNSCLLHLSRCDEVTGLYNQRHLMERLDEEFRRARRYTTTLSLLIADVDGFKVFNDSRGHPAGDELLRQIGEAIRRTIRASDVAARYGGDEFVILLPQTTEEQAARLAERLRAAIAALPENMSVSIGVASLATGISEPLELVAEADHAMYRAKALGRNRVIRGIATSWTSGTSSSA